MKDHSNKKETQKIDIHLLSRFLNYLKPYKFMVILMYIMTILNVGSTIIIPIYMKIGIDDYIANHNLNGLIFITILFFITLIVLYVSSRFQGYLLTKIGYNVLFNLRSDLFSHLQSLSFRFFDTHKTGNIMTRMTSDVQVLEEMLQGGLDTLVVDLLMLISITLVMLILDIRLSLVLFITIPLFAFLVFYVRGKMVQIARKIQKKLSSVNSFLNESISGIKVIRSLSKEEDNSRKFKEINQDFYKGARDFYPLNAFFWAGVTILSGLGVAFVLLGGGILLSFNMITIGVIAAFLGYINRFFQPIQKLSNLLNNISRAMASCERIFGILDEVPNILDSTQAVENPEIHGHIKFIDVSFSYEENEPVLNNISFDIPAGKTAAFVGATGAGKTTLFNLICRFYDPINGKVVIDKYDLKELKQKDYRSNIAVVLQDATIFSGSIRDNIAYARPGVSQNEIEFIASEMGVHEVFKNQPYGYNTIIGERGSSLSLGQKQLIAFSRALLRDPKILLLDEASAYIDTVTEKLIQKAMYRLRQNRTTFIIAHRLSTIRDADIIFVMENGRIVERGDHDTLVQNKGPYAELLKTQYAVS
ncbi:MAG: ABC transporter ATP-binding protein [Spirochaetales bacterium]|nr:ABC transporter ATP-binding protein [Spirochaetales bacterium]